MSVGMMAGQAVAMGMGMRIPVSGRMGLLLMTNEVAPGMVPGSYMSGYPSYW